MSSQGPRRPHRSPAASAPPSRDEFSAEEVLFRKVLDSDDGAFEALLADLSRTVVSRKNRPPIVHKGVQAK